LSGAFLSLQVGRCVQLCAQAGATLAGLQPGLAMQSNKRGGAKAKGTSCYCGASIGAS
jgi:hypothetical protein